MNKQLMSILLVLSLPLTGFALQLQQGNPGLPDEGQVIDGMTKGQGLNEEQKAKVAAIFNEEKAKFKALEEETSAGRS